MNWYFGGFWTSSPFVWEKSGMTLRLTARSEAALLLDNEALPQTYINPSLKQLFDRHAAPYGFAGMAGNQGAFRGKLTVKKGMSEWQVFEEFCGYFLGTTPRVTYLGILDATGKPSEKQVFFSNQGGISYRSFDPSRMVSQANQPDPFAGRRQGGLSGSCDRCGDRRNGNPAQTVPHCYQLHGKPEFENCPALRRGMGAVLPIAFGGGIGSWCAGVRPSFGKDRRCDGGKTGVSVGQQGRIVYCDTAERRMGTITQKKGWICDVDGKKNHGLSARGGRDPPTGNGDPYWREPGGGSRGGGLL